MKKNIKFILAISFYITSVFFSSCYNPRDKTHYYKSYKICNNLSAVTYRVFGGGAYGGDMISEYITDSTNFRKFIGVWDNALEVYLYDCKGDSLIVRKYSIHGISRELIDERIILINDLKAKKKFE